MDKESGLQLEAAGKRLDLLKFDLESSQFQDASSKSDHPEQPTRKNRKLEPKQNSKARLERGQDQNVNANQNHHQSHGQQEAGKPQAAALFMSTVSNSRLHCCLLGLILFILIFLSLPLLLIYLANTRYEEQQESLSQLANHSHSPAQLGPTTTSGLLHLREGRPPNCTQFALDAKLALIGNKRK